MVAAHTAEVASRAKQLYRDSLQSKLEGAHRDEFVAIEPDSGDYFLGSTLSEAIQSARRAYPDRLSFAMRIGHDSTVQIGVLSS